MGEIELHRLLCPKVGEVFSSVFNFSNLFSTFFFWDRLQNDRLGWIQIRTSDWTNVETVPVHDVKSYYLKSNNLNTEEQPAIVPEKGSKDSLADGQPDGFYVNVEIGWLSFI